MKEILFTNKEIINIVFGILIGIIPTFFDIRKGKNKNRKLNYKGWILVSICITFVLFSVFTICQENKRIKNDDIVLKFSLRSPTPFSSYHEISDKIPTEI